MPHWHFALQATSMHQNDQDFAAQYPRQVRCALMFVSRVLATVPSWVGVMYCIAGWWGRRDLC